MDYKQLLINGLDETSHSKQLHTKMAVSSISSAFDLGHSLKEILSGERPIFTVNYKVYTKNKKKLTKKYGTRWQFFLDNNKIFDDFSNSKSLEEYGMSITDTKEILKGITKEIIDNISLSDITKDIHKVLLNSLIDNGYFKYLTPSESMKLYADTQIDYFLPSEVKDTFIF